jgi:hypothetical protein
MTTDLEKTASIAERLVFSLQRTAENPANVSLANTALYDFLEALPSLQETLRDLTRSRLTEQITQAAGNAATHQWRVRDDHDLIECAVCGCGPVGYLLASGSVPTCSPNTDCKHGIYGGQTLRRDDAPADSGACIYCKTVYPATAGVECVGDAQ